MRAVQLQSLQVIRFIHTAGIADTRGLPSHAAACTSRFMPALPASCLAQGFIACAKPGALMQNLAPSLMLASQIMEAFASVQ